MVCPVFVYLISHQLSPLSQNHGHENAVRVFSVEILVQEEVLFCFPFIGLTGQYGCNAISGKDGLSEYRKDGEYVLTYEDKDGDWMLVGDVPWE